MSRDIRDLIFEAIKTDDSYSNVNSKNILKIYENSTPNEKEKINNIFINLCGFSFESLLAKSKLDLGQKTQDKNGFDFLETHP